MVSEMYNRLQSQKSIVRAKHRALLSVPQSAAQQKMPADDSEDSKAHDPRKALPLSTAKTLELGQLLRLLGDVRFLRATQECRRTLGPSLWRLQGSTGQRLQCLRLWPPARLMEEGILKENCQVLKPLKT